MILIAQTINTLWHPLSTEAQQNSDNKLFGSLYRQERSVTTFFGMKKKVHLYISANSGVFSDMAVMILKVRCFFILFKIHLGREGVVGWLQQIRVFTQETSVHVPCETKS